MPANIFFWFINFMTLFKKLAYFLRNNILLIFIFVLMYYRGSLEEVLEIYSICSFILINPSKPVTSQVYYFKHPVIDKNKIRDITKSNSSGV
jgi:hypothetical protein